MSEAHLYFDNMYKIDFHSNTRKTLYLTATPARSSRDEDIIYKEYFKNIPSIELFDANTDPHVNYVGVLFNSGVNPEEIKKYSVGQFNFDRNIYTGILVQKEKFLKLVVIMIDIALKIDGKVLIYIGINNAIEFIKMYILDKFPFLDGHIGVYNSVITDKNSRKLMLTKKIILSTTKSCGAASDIAHLSATMVLAEPFKSSVTARQTLGRCRADNTMYFDCVDLGCYRTREYYKYKKPIFNKYAKSCKELFLTDDILDQKYNEVLEYYNSNTPPTIPVYNE